MNTKLFTIDELYDLSSAMDCISNIPSLDIKDILKGNDYDSRLDELSQTSFLQDLKDVTINVSSNFKDLDDLSRDNYNSDEAYIEARQNIINSIKVSLSNYLINYCKENNNG